MKKAWNLIIAAALACSLVFSAVCYSFAAENTAEDSVLIYSEEEQLFDDAEESTDSPEANVPVKEEQEEPAVPAEDDGKEEQKESAAPAEESTEEKQEEDPAIPETAPQMQETERQDLSEDELFTDEGTARQEEEDLFPAENTQNEEAGLQLKEEQEFSVVETAAAGKYQLSSVKLAYTRMVYSGLPKKQSGSSVVKAVVNGENKVLTLGTDYKVRYKNNIEIGTATAVFTGIGDYTGTITKTFKIVPRGTSIYSIYAGTKCITLKWAKRSAPVQGYVIHYATKSDFSDHKVIWVKDRKTGSNVIKGLTSGKKYYVRVRTYKNVDGVKYYSIWSAVKTVELTYNTVKVTGSGATRTVSLVNPKKSVTSARVAVWSHANGQDDKKWYSMKKDSNGTWKATIRFAYLKDVGNCTAKVYMESTYLNKRCFTVSEEDYKASENTVLVSGSGSTRKVTVLHPAGIKNAKVAVWSDDSQRDLQWYPMTIQSNGTWTAIISTLPLIREGTCEAHVYANDGNDFIGNATFDNTLCDRSIEWNTAWEFADYSKVHTGRAKIYRATKNRKNIVVGINSGHGTILPAGQDNYVYSHPDHTPKVTGGSTAAGSVWTICDNTGMCFNDGTPEANVTLQQGLILKDVLLEAGYDVIVIRENNDSGLDVIARTVICNNLADCHISLHWDGDGLSYDKGIFYMSVPDALKGMYPTSTIWSESNRLGDSVIQGMQQKGLPIFGGGSMQMDLMQTSYSKVPSIDIELGNQSSTHTDNDLRIRAEGMLAGLNIFFGQN